MDLVFYYTNANSILSKLSEFYAEVSRLNPTFILVSETWLHNDIPDSLINIQNYVLHRHDRQNRRGGGVLIYAKEHIDNFKITVSTIQITPLPSETDALILDVAVSNFKFCLQCIYRPPENSIEQTQELIDYLVKAGANCSNMVIFGDFNYPHINWESLTLTQPNQSSEIFLNFYKETNYKQLIKFKTRIRNEQKSLLDLLLTTDEKLFVQTSSHPPLGCSDHVAIQARAQVKIKGKSTRKVEKRNFWKADYDTINNKISQRNFSDSMEDCITIIQSVISENIPLRNVTSNPQKPWINDYIFRQIKQKRKSWDNYRRLQTNASYQEYRRQNNKVKKLLKEAQEQYEAGLLERPDKYFYSYIRRAINSNTSSITLKNQDRELIKDPNETAESLAIQFEKVFTNESMNNFPSLPITTRSDAEITTIHHTPQTICDILKNLKKESSPGPDLIPPVFLVNCANTLSEPLSIAMDKLLELTSFPSIWSKAIITPIYKKGDKYNPENYRPISLTCSLCKIMEKAIVRELTAFLLENKVIPNTQHGFLPQRSTITNLLSCTNNWTIDVDVGESIDVIYLDYEKAFDKVPIERLLYKLEHFGVRGRLLTWIACFLRNRTYTVRANGVSSASHAVLSGVPQGSVLGPLLFLAYISDLSLEVTSSIVYFADDTKLFCNTKNSDQLKRDLEALEEWTSKWNLRLNNNKCTVLHLGRNNPKLQYSLNNSFLQSVELQKDLGVFISQDLKWESHIAHIVKKANSLIYLIQRAFSNTSVEMISKLHKTFIRPKLEYACTVWNPYYIKDITLLERVQRKITRIPDVNKHLSYAERLTNFNIPTLKERRERGDMIEVYKELSGHYSPMIELSLFHANETRELRGHTKKLRKERCSLLLRKNFITNRVVYRWNGLQEETVTAPNVNTFKNRLDRESTRNNNQLVHYL